MSLNDYLEGGSLSSAPKPSFPMLELWERCGEYYIYIRPMYGYKVLTPWNPWEVNHEGYLDTLEEARSLVKMLPGRPSGIGGLKR